MRSKKDSNYVPWYVERGIGPLLGLALHDGHDIRGNLEGRLALGDLERLREEDPFTGEWTSVSPSRIIVSQSRFEFDLNRPRAKAIYQRPEDAWGLKVWAEPLSKVDVSKSLSIYDLFYDEIHVLLNRMVQRYGKIAVLDFHSYNCKRGGPGSEIDTAAHPEINIGTGTMDRKYWSSLVDRVIVDLRNYDFLGNHLDVRENIVFKGGHFAEWAHKHFPETVCVISIEVRKLFMDEWTGEPNRVMIDNLHKAFKSCVWGIYEELGHLKHNYHPMEA